MDTIAEKTAYYSNIVCTVCLLLALMLAFTLPPNPIVISLALISAWAGGYYGSHAIFDSAVGARAERLEKAVEAHKKETLAWEPPKREPLKTPSLIPDITLVCITMLITIGAIVFAINTIDDAKTLRAFCLLALSGACASGFLTGMTVWNIHMNKRHKYLEEKICGKQNQ